MSEYAILHEYPKTDGKYIHLQVYKDEESAIKDFSYYPNGQLVLVDYNYTVIIPQLKAVKP